jgi:hypothetical protein
MKKIEGDNLSVKRVNKLKKIIGTIKLNEESFEKINDLIKIQKLRNIKLKENILRERYQYGCINTFKNIMKKKN